MAQAPVNQILSADLLVSAQKQIERGELESAEHVLLDAIKQADAQAVSERTVRARVMLAEVYEGLGRYKEVEPLLANYNLHALDEYPAYLRGLLLLAFGSYSCWTNEFSRSVTLLNRAREILEPTGDTSNLARTYHCLGRTYWLLDEQSLAREHYELAIEWGRRARKDRALAITYMNLGLVSRHEGDLDEAGMCYRRALRLLRQTNDEASRARLQNNLGVMLLYQGNFYEAGNSLRRALEHLAGFHSDDLLGHVNNNLAVTCIHTGEWSAAESHVQQALTIARQRNNQLEEGSFTETLGLLRMLQGRTQEANDLLRFALDCGKEVGSKSLETYTYLSLAQLWLAERNTHLSLTYARNARDLAREVGDERVASEAALGQVDARRRLGRHRAKRA
jgi:tetratricopeptide (TPR) repeat protein